MKNKNNINQSRTNGIVESQGRGGEWIYSQSVVVVMMEEAVAYDDEHDDDDRRYRAG